MIRDSALINAVEWFHPSKHFHRATSQPILPMAEEYQHLQQHPRMSILIGIFGRWLNVASKLVDISEHFVSLVMLGTFVRLLWHHPKMSHDKSRKNQPDQSLFQLAYPLPSQPNAGNILRLYRFQDLSGFLHPQCNLFKNGICLHLCASPFFDIHPSKYFSVPRLANMMHKPLLILWMTFLIFQGQVAISHIAFSLRRIFLFDKILYNIIFESCMSDAK